MNNEFDITKVRFGNYLQGVKEGCEGYIADSMSALYDYVVHNNQRYYSKILRIDDCSEYPFVRHRDVAYRYFYLVAEPKEKRYRPYTWEERKQLRGKWFKKGDGKSEEELIVDLYISHNGLFVINGKSSESLLKYYVWLDGSPCGVEIMEEE